MKTLRHFAPALLLIILSATKMISAREFLPIVNPNFSNIAAECSTRYVYQAAPGATCAGPNVPQQDLNGTLGIGWGFTAPAPSVDGSGLTGADTGFNPPSFVGFPFVQAAFLQAEHCQVWQTIFGFVAGTEYRLSFYLGSRYYTGEGEQTVLVMIDDRVIGIYSLVSFTPFTLQSKLFQVATNGPHTLRFVGTTSGVGTAFFSGVSIEALGPDDDK